MVRFLSAQHEIQVSPRRALVAMFTYLNLTLKLSLAGLRLAFVLVVVGLPAISPLISEVMDTVVEVETCEDCEACVANSRQERRFSASAWGVAKHHADTVCRALAVQRHHATVGGHRLHNGILAPLQC